jgi:chromosome segregation ATPase
MSEKYLVDFQITGKYNEKPGNGFGIYTYDTSYFYFKIDLNGNVDIKMKPQYHSQTYVSLLNINDNIPLQQSLITKLKNKYQDKQHKTSLYENNNNTSRNHSEDIIYFIEFIKKINEENKKKEQEYNECIKALNTELTTNKEEYNNTLNAALNALKEELTQKEEQNNKYMTNIISLDTELCKSKEESRKKINKLNDEKWKLTDELINTKIMQKKKEEETNDSSNSLQKEKEKNETLMNDNEDLLRKLVSCVTVYSFLICIILIIYLREIESHYIH